MFVNSCRTASPVPCFVFATLAYPTPSPHRHLEDAILARLKKNKNKKQIGHHARPMHSQQELSAVQRATARASIFNQGVGGTVSQS